ncbi:MAG TPA: hypothetical protein VLL52_20240, partial [Anaerolineae bacterium]|nr:hypothetical protein [Anaerolineae bacterium]
GFRGMSGAHLLLLPGLIAMGLVACYEDWRHKRLLYTVPLLWAGGHVFAYAWRLPVTYQHGRYLLPVMGVWVIYGLMGWWVIGAYRWPVGEMVLWAGGLVGRLTFVIMILFFLILGGQGYGVDVAFIEGEMVTVAKWVADNTEEGGLVATHDIGALGYFGERPLLDLAGLISPEVADYLHDEQALATYVRQQQADYLVTAPGWPYPLLTADKTAIFSTEYEWTILNGVNNMAVYELRSN